jgi:hypothetical protein
MEEIEMKKCTLLVLGLTIVCLSLSFTCFAADKPKEIGKEEHWAAYDDGTVLDTKTGLMWASQSSKPLPWTDAKAYCDNYGGSGYTDWRMPTTEELMTIFDPWLQNPKGYKLTKYIIIEACCPWSTETKPNDEADHYRHQVDFERGEAFFARKIGAINGVGLPVRETKK